MTAVAVALAVHGITSWSYAAASADSETQTYNRLHATAAEAVHWASHNIPDDELIASPAYREFTQRLGGRRILPVGYSSDPATLWAETGGAGAEWFINTEQYPRRARIGRVLVRSYRDRFEKVFDNNEVTIYRITPGG